MSDYIPEGDYPVLAWATNFHNVCSDNVSAWNLPEARIGPMGNAITDFGVILEKCHSETKTKADTKDKDLQREALETDIREFVNEYIRANHLVTDVDKVRLGVTVPEDAQDRPDTTDTPELEADISTPGLIVLRYRVKGKKHWGKGKYIHGIETRYEMREDNPAKWEDLKNTIFDTGGTVTIEFDPADAGKRVVINSRWEMNKVDGNRRGKGPWGTPIVVHVPG
jgi:hypothetical protein